MSLPRTLGRKYTQRNLKAFLEMIDTAVQTSSGVDDIYKTFAKFDPETRDFGPAVLTGIVSALRPKEFMVYNNRSAAMLSEISEHRDLMYTDMSRYKRFNDLYKRICKITKKDMFELDLVAAFVWNEHKADD